MSNLLEQAQAMRPCPRCRNYRSMHVSVARVEDEPFQHVLIMVLCLTCWAESSVEDRLGYYHKFWLRSNPGPHELGQWFEIESVVREESGR